MVVLEYLLAQLLYGAVILPVYQQVGNFVMARTEHLIYEIDLLWDRAVILVVNHGEVDGIILALVCMYQAIREVKKVIF